MQCFRIGFAVVQGVFFREFSMRRYPATIIRLKKHMSNGENAGESNRQRLYFQNIFNYMFCLRSIHHIYKT